MKKPLINKLFNYRNKVVLITGSSGLIGKSLSHLFLLNGSNVIGIDKISSNTKHKRFYHYHVDLSKKNDVEHTLTKVVKKFKKIDLIINNAGFSVFTKFDKRTDKEIQDTINGNIISTLNVINSYFKIHRMKKLTKSNVINFGSIYGFLSPDFSIYGKKDNFNSEIYGATKAGIIQLTKYYSVILAKHKIRVNCLSPGGIINQNNPPNSRFIKKYSSRVPQKRIGLVQDLYTAVLFLGSEYSDYINGQNICVDGGLSCW